MKKSLLVCIAVSFCISCKKEANKSTVVRNEKGQGKNFEMYEMSEMAMLMEQMYVDNEQLRNRIKRGDTIGKFPNHFLEIHAAVMTDQLENDAFFKMQAANFIQAQELIYEDPKNAKDHFNKGVDACIKCHEVKCSCPIPRIKKLYIK
jgi:esterase/lipase